MPNSNKISYLSQLKFDPKLRNKWWAKYLINIRLVLLLILVLVSVGVFSYLNVPRRVNPEVKIPIVIISTVLPGASPADIESLVTIPLEDSLDNVEGIDSMVSNSRENVSAITLQFLSNVDGDKALQDVQREIDSVDDLPDDANSPNVRLLDFENQPIWTFTISGQGGDASLMRFSKMLKDNLEDLNKINRVELSGFDTQEIQVIVDEKKIAEYGINPAVLSQAVKAATSSYPAGSVVNNNLSYSIGINRDVEDIEDVRELVITSNGQQFRLGDLAEVIERSKLDQAKTYLVNFLENDGGNRSIGSHADALYEQQPSVAVQFFVFKSEDSNIDAAEKDARDLVDKTISEYGGEFKATTIVNTADEIVKQFDELFREFGATIVLVFVLLVVFLGIRQSIISLLTIPLTLLCAMIVINVMGFSLNFLTAFSFLIALGLLIDDTIVIVAAMTRYYLSGKFTPEETAILVWRDFIVPLWSTTITVIWAFVPLLLATGIIGEFIKSIPIIVTATMISSTSIAVLITIPLMVVILKPKIARRVNILLKTIGVLIVIGLVSTFIPKSDFYMPILVLAVLCLFIIYLAREGLRQSIDRLRNYRAFKKIKLDPVKKGFRDGFLNIEILSGKYKVAIDKILSSAVLRRSTLIAVVVFAVVGYLLVPLGFVKNEFFPKTDEDVLYLQVDYPDGTNLANVNNEMLSFIKEIKPRPEVSYFVADVGAGLGSNDSRSDSPGSFLLTFHLVPNERRSATASDIANDLRDNFKNYTKGTVNVVELSGGPPVGADIQVSLLGDDLTVLGDYADKVKDWLRKQEGVTNVQSSNKASTSKIVFVPDKNKLKEAGLTVDSLGLWLRTYASGFTLDTIKVNNTDKDITFLMDSNVQSAGDISKIMVPSQGNGGSGGSSEQIPLLGLGSLKLENNPASITRMDGSREVSVTAGVLAGVSSTEKNAELVKYVEELNLPEGYTWQTGGVNEENEKSVQSILQAMLLSFLLILVTMVIEFGSYRQTLIALLLIPLGITGVFYMFALTGTPLSFPALIGILALFGIVVRHGIIVIEKINENRRNGMRLQEALVDAAGSRLEPVLLTSIAAIAGLIPITLSDPLWRGLGGAIIAGLLFSGAIKLFFVPIVYYEWFKKNSESRSKK